jgi:hypothetical protein
MKFCDELDTLRAQHHADLDAAVRWAVRTYTKDQGDRWTAVGDAAVARYWREKGAP